MRKSIASNNEIKELIAEMEKLQAQKSVIEKQYNSIKKTITDRLIAPDLNDKDTVYEYELGLDSNKILRYELVPTTRFDTKRFTAECPELKAKYTNATVNKVFKIIEEKSEEKVEK